MFLANVTITGDLQGVMNAAYHLKKLLRNSCRNCHGAFLKDRNMEVLQCLQKKNPCSKNESVGIETKRAQLISFQDIAFDFLCFNKNSSCIHIPSKLVLN